MARQRTADDSMTYWFPWKHPITRRRGLEFVVFDQTSSRPCGPCCSILFPPQNYHSQSIGSALRVSPFVSFGTFARKHNPFEHCKCTRPKFFALSMCASLSRTCCDRLRPHRVCGKRQENQGDSFRNQIFLFAHHVAQHIEHIRDVMTTHFTYLYCSVFFVICNLWGMCVFLCC